MKEENRIKTLKELKKRGVEQSEENDTFMIRGKVLRDLLEIEWMYEDLQH